MLVASKTQNILDGLEFRIALGNTWKENLSELSGGQRWVNFVGFSCLSYIAVVCVIGMSS